MAAPPRRRAPDEGVDGTPASLGAGSLTQGGGQGHISVDGGAGQSVPTPLLAPPPTSPLRGGGRRRGGRGGEARGRHRGRGGGTVGPLSWTRPRAGRGSRHRGLGRQMVAGITVVDEAAGPVAIDRGRHRGTVGPSLRTRPGADRGARRCGPGSRKSAGPAAADEAARLVAARARLRGPWLPPWTSPLGGCRARRGGRGGGACGRRPWTGKTASPSLSTTAP